MPSKLLWSIRIVCAGILLQTLYFKFTAAPESVYIFTKVGAEPVGRIGSGIVELIASLLILIPALTGYGALLSLGTMTGAIFSHLTVLGIDVMGDGGMLFALAITVWCGSLAMVWEYRKQIPVLNKVFK